VIVHGLFIFSPDVAKPKPYFVEDQSRQPRPMIGETLRIVKLAVDRHGHTPTTT
jgi:hypothetical protein